MEVVGSWLRWSENACAIEATICFYDHADCLLHLFEVVSEGILLVDGKANGLEGSGTSHACDILQLSICKDRPRRW